MTKIIALETERLKLRQWKDIDYPKFAEMNSDPEVMAYFPETLSKSVSNELADRLQSLISKRGWGFWAVEEKKNQEFIGFVGLHEPIPELSFAPCVEIGWRLAKEHWGKGYATEAAHESLHFAFGHLDLSEVYSYAVVKNFRSRAVMERLRMVNLNQNFEYPKFPVGSLLREQVLYKLTKQQWVT